MDVGRVPRGCGTAFVCSEFFPPILGPECGALAGHNYQAALCALLGCYGLALPPLQLSQHPKIPQYKCLEQNLPNE